MSPSPHRLLLGALGAASALALSACVTPQNLGPRPQPRPLQGAASTAAPSPVLPQSPWWRAYGDPQLDALIEAAVRDAPSMAQASARLRRAEALAQGAGAMRLPTLAANGSVSEARPSELMGIPVLAERQGLNDYGRSTLDFGWELDFWGKNRAALAAATSERNAAQAEFAAARLVLTTSIAAAYADLARLYADRDALQASLKVRRASLELVQLRYDQGYDSQAELAQAQAGPPTVLAEIAATDELIAIDQDRLAALAGREPSAGAAITRPAKARLASAASSTLPLDLLGRRPDVVAARWRVEAASARERQAKTSFYPNVNLVGLVGFDALGLERLGQSGSTVASVGPAISLPIFDGGRRRASYGAAASERDLAVAVYDDTLIHAMQDVADAQRSRAFLDERLAQTRQSVEANNRAYETAMLRYKSGSSDFQAVLIVEDRLLAARRILAALEARAFVLDVALVRAAGGGVETPAPEVTTNARS